MCPNALSAPTISSHAIYRVDVSTIMSLATNSNLWGRQSLLYMLVNWGPQKLSNLPRFTELYSCQNEDWNPGLLTPQVLLSHRRCSFDSFSSHNSWIYPMSQRLCFTRGPLVRLKLCWCSAFLSTSKDFAIYLSVPDQGLVPRMLCYCFWPYSVRSWREQMATAVWIMRVWSQAGLENELRALLIYYCFYS